MHGTLDKMLAMREVFPTLSFAEPALTWRRMKNRLLPAQHVCTKSLVCGNQTGRDIARSDVLAQRARHLIGQISGQLAQNGNG